MTEKPQYMTATGLQEMNREYWRRTAPIIERRVNAVLDKFMEPLVDKLIRITLKHEGLSYRKFMFNRAKLQIEVE